MSWLYTFKGVIEISQIDKRSYNTTKKVGIMLVMAVTKLATLRGQFNPKVTQEDVARKAGMPLVTYRNAEKGKNVSYTTATTILAAINALRTERVQAPVNLDDLGLHIV
jgi:DNA-binding XRE family transcriptional regulator